MINQIGKLLPLSIIVARSKNGVIGNAGKIPWHYKYDLQYFKSVTLNHAVIMGRKTYESIGQPLPKRHNIVVTRNPNLQLDGCNIASDLKTALLIARKYDAQPFIIGGAQLYCGALPMATKLYITEIPIEIDGDTFFPEFDEREWNEVKSEEHFGLNFRILQRVKI